MIVAGAGDALSLRIPNWLTALIAMAVLSRWRWPTGMPWFELGLHVLTGFALFFVGFALFALGLFGGGDAKLIAAAGLWFGWPDVVPFLVLTVFAGGAAGPGGRRMGRGEHECRDQGADLVQALLPV